MAADGGYATDTAPKSAPTPKVRKGRKFDQVLEGARNVFMAHGFEGASVDDIAREAGVSKATLYSYFPDKKLLFMEVAKSECTRQAGNAIDTIDMTAPPRVVMPTFARRLIDFILSDLGRAFFRVCVAEADRFPELGRQFYESGPLVARAAMEGYLEGAAARGEVEIQDFALAAEQFGELCKCDVWLRSLFNIDNAFSEDEIARVINGAVETWLARYGTD